MIQAVHAPHNRQLNSTAETTDSDVHPRDAQIIECSISNYGKRLLDHSVSWCAQGTTGGDRGEHTGCAGEVSSAKCASLLKADVLKLATPEVTW